MSERLDFVLRLVDKITAPSKRAAKSLGGIDKQLTNIGRNQGFKKYEIGAKDAVRATDRLRDSGRGLISLSANLNLAANSMRGLSRAAATVFIAPIKEAATFDKAMAAVRARTNNFSQGQIDEARRLGAETKFTAIEAASGMEKLAMAGFTAQQQMSALGSVLDLDVATGNDNVARTADIATNIMGGFGIEAKDFTGTADTMVRVLNNSNLVLEELGETMSFAAPVARKLGISLETTAVLAGALGDAGIKGSRGGTALRLMMTNLAGAAPPAMKAMKKLGIETQDAAGNLLPIESILQNITKDFQNLGNAKQTQLATKIFGLRGASAGLILLDQLSTKAGGSIGKLQRALAKTDVTAKSTAEEMEDQLLGDITQVTSAFNSLQIEIGNQFTPELRDLAIAIKELIPPMVEWVKENKGMVVDIGKVVAGFAVLTGVLAGVATAASAVALIWGGLTLAAIPFVAAWGAIVKLKLIFDLLWIGMAGPAFIAAKATLVTGLKAIGAALLPITGLVAAVTVGWVAAIVVWWDEIKALVAMIPSEFLALGADMATSLIDGWKSVFGGFNIVEDIDAVVQRIKSAVGITARATQGMSINMAASPAKLTGAAQAAARGGDRTMTFSPIVNVTTGGGGSGASESEGESVGDSAVNALRKMFDDGVTALAAG